MKFAIVGMGFIAERHIEAIKAVGGKIICVCDIDKSKFMWGPEDRGPETFTDWEDMFESIIFSTVDYVVILTPNYLHFKMITKARQLDKKVICEKPFVLSIDDLMMMKKDTGVNIMLQLRYAYNLVRNWKYAGFNYVKMDINVHRGDWYFDSWKADIEKSGGLMWNIGVHYFDIINQEFGPFIDYKVSFMDSKFMKGELSNGKAIVNWTLSIDAPVDKQQRLIRLNRRYAVNFTEYIKPNGTIERMDKLHIKAYKEILNGNGIHPRDLFSLTKLIGNMTKTAIEGKENA